MLTKCVNCEFYVKKDDPFCLNCGIKSPTEDYSQPSPKLLVIARLAKSKLLLLILSVAVIAFTLYWITDGDFSSIPYLRDYIIFAVIFFGVGETFLTLFLLNKWCLKKLYPKRPKNHDNFTSRRKTIDKRLSELTRRARTIDSVLSKIGDNSSPELRKMRPKLRSARKILNGQSARYELQKRKIELVRLQNGVSRYLFGLHRLNEFETENGLVTIETARTQIDKIRQKLARSELVEVPAGALAEQRGFIDQLEETDESCQKLREALLSRQAARALQDISPVGKNLKLPDSPELVRETEIFNIQTTLTDFSESFAELEREYRRLRAEEELEQKLLTE
jgi:hypothetical protein